ncbi:DUF2628 domain-containing protein [Methyloceanibacter superfactus]|uniref:DUF2628 domain-containing protein n=1 Tax=Methyloceanibacter superfactus TaxID=1774969 RepID=UPI0009F44610|nr:DUF2628 domain-containing protein [Methyloceanibacter superfactus]
MTRLRHEVTVYSVYEPVSDDDDIAARADRVAFVKDGFSWLALIVPALWLLYHRMWIEFIVFMAIIFGLEWAFGAGRQGPEIVGWLSLAVTVLFAFEANDLRGAMLERRGYRFAGVATGRSRQEAERSFFTRWLRQQDRPRYAVPPPQQITPGTKPAAPPRRRDGDDVIGLFPQG